MSRRIVIGAVLAAITIFETLNFTGFCYNKGTWPTDQELIDAAVQYEIDHVGPVYLAEGAKKYASVEEFHRLNPLCCQLAKWGDPYAPLLQRRPMVWVRRILGQELLIVDLWYRFRESGPAPFTTASYLIDACGNVRHAGLGGSANTATGPTRIWATGQ